MVTGNFRSAVATPGKKKWRCDTLSKREPRHHRRGALGVVSVVANLSAAQSGARVIWLSLNAAGKEAVSGVYFCRVKSENVVETTK